MCLFSRGFTALNPPKFSFSLSLALHHLEFTAFKDKNTKQSENKAGATVARRKILFPFLFACGLCLLCIRGREQSCNASGVNRAPGQVCICHCDSPNESHLHHGEDTDKGATVTTREQQSVYCIKKL